MPLLDDEECAVPTQRRRAKSFQQRLAEKTMRAKRLTMAKEAHHWYMKGDASKLKEPDKSSASCSTAITPKKRNKMSSSAKSSYTPQKSTFPSRTKTTMTQTLRRTFPYNCDTDRVQTHLRLAGFTTPNRKENDTVSLRSGGSEVKRRVILDVIQWDSE
jgi:Tfp pilus assembly protein FimT